MLQLILFIFSSYVLFVFSNKNQQKLFRLFYKITHNPTLSAGLISLLYFPGIVLHEFSHFITGVLLFIDVRSISFIPRATYSEDGKSIGLQLGHVTYIKADPIRGFFVGIAPFFYGLLAFFALHLYVTFPSSSILVNALIIYLTFVISSTMFWSTEDLKDLIYMIPVVLVIALIIFLTGFDIGSGVHFLISNKNVIDFLRQSTIYLFLSALINIVVYIIFSILRLS
ncbi:MAG: hypothetical protein ACMG6E_05350 [Candidatus Roizmanbacteria bacterium]